jgi:hypothetical protein
VIGFLYFFWQWKCEVERDEYLDIQFAPRLSLGTCSHLVFQASLSSDPRWVNMCLGKGCWPNQCSPPAQGKAHYTQEERTWPHRLCSCGEFYCRDLGCLPSNGNRSPLYLISLSESSVTHGQL